MQWHRIPKPRRRRSKTFVKKPYHDDGVETRPLTEDEWLNRKRRK